MEQPFTKTKVKYMTRGATWSPSYDLRVDTQTDTISCTYYGMVTQSTTEDWEGEQCESSTMVLLSVLCFIICQGGYINLSL